MKTLVEMLKTGKTGSRKRDSESVYVVTENAIVIRKFRKYGGNSQYVLAIKSGNEIIGNSSSLGIPRLQRNVIPEQLELESIIPMIPFSSLKASGLKVSTYQKLDSTPHESVNVLVVEYVRQELLQKKIEELSKCSDISNIKVETSGISYLKDRHFTGAQFFSCEDESGKRHKYLLDIDREEIKHGIFNAFMVKIAGEGVNSVKGAYDWLKPEAVKVAEAENVKVERQGEWFFVKVDNFSKDVETMGQIETDQALCVGNNRPNIVEKVIRGSDNKVYCAGTVRHRGREHRDLNLANWYVAVPNSATESWTLGGDID